MPQNSLDNKLCQSLFFNKDAGGAWCMHYGANVFQMPPVAASKYAWVYFENVDVFFQKHAWADTKSSIGWAEKMLVCWIQDLTRHVLLCDTLTDQISNVFKEATLIKFDVIWFGLSSGTSL